jgi:putative membrane protein
MSLSDALALANACLVALSATSVLLGYRAIRRKDVPRHRRLMLIGVAAAAAFMALFVVRFVEFGFRPVSGQGVRLLLYRIIFFSHEPMAVISVPLVLATVGLGLAGAFAVHKEIARWALPIWLYSSATGILIYLLQ